MNNKKQEFDKLYYNELGMCGCGNPDDLKKLIYRILFIQSLSKDIPYEQRKIMRLKAIDECGVENVLDFFFHIFDHNGLMEHGGYIGNGWVTQKGKDPMKLLYLEIHGYLDHDWDDMDEHLKLTGVTDEHGNIINPLI